MSKSFDNGVLFFVLCLFFFFPIFHLNLEQALINNNDLYIYRLDFDAEDAFYANLLNEKYSHVFYEQFPSRLFK